MQCLASPSDTDCRSIQARQRVEVRLPDPCCRLNFPRRGPRALTPGSGRVEPRPLGSGRQGSYSDRVLPRPRVSVKRVTGPFMSQAVLCWTRWSEGVLVSPLEARGPAGPRRSSSLRLLSFRPVPRTLLALRCCTSPESVTFPSRRSARMGFQHFHCGVRIVAAGHSRGPSNVVVP